MKKSIINTIMMFVVVFATSVSYGQFITGGGYQGGGHGSGGDETFGKCQDLYMFDGWSGVSAYLSPYVKDAENLFAPIEGSLTILYNLNGVYWPATGTNTLGPWNEYSGYVVKVEGDSYMSFCGDEVTNKTVNLDANWNLIPVLSKSSTNAASLFAGLSGFQVAKEVVGGGVYWPLYNINTLISLKAGSAYYVYTTSPGSITYTTKSDMINSEKPVEFENISPWNDVCQTPATHIVALTKEAVAAFTPGDIIGAFTNMDLCAGMVRYIGNETALTLNGDDITTDISDGFALNENIKYRLYRPSTDQIFDLEVVYDLSLDNTGTFATNSLSAITGVMLTGTGAGPMAEEIRIFPNPSIGIFNIEGSYADVEISIFSAFGEEVMYKEMTLPDQVDLTGQPKGVYFIRISSDRGSYFSKLVIN